jgi:hypothetical protein
MNAFLQSLRHYFDLLLNSPHHLLVYIAAAAVLLICIPILRSTFGSRRKATSTVDVAYPSMFGLTTPAVDQIDFRPRIEFSPEPVPIPPKSVTSISAPIPPRSVTAINESSTVPCIHCGISMSSHRDFCPACGYAQPMKQSVTA